MSRFERIRMSYELETREWVAFIFVLVGSVGAFFVSVGLFLSGYTYAGGLLLVTGFGLFAAAFSIFSEKKYVTVTRSVVLEHKLFQYKK